MDRVYSKDDKSSLSNPNAAITTNLVLDWTIDFHNRFISGTCIHTISVIGDNVEYVDFDSSHLAISSTKVNGTVVPFEVLAPHPSLGSKISVSIPKVC